MISYDPNYRASLWPDEKTAKKHMRSLVPYVDLMKISDEETELLTDHKDVREAAEALYSQGVKVVAVTLEGICPFRQCSGQSLRGEKRCDPGNAGACTGGTQNCKVIVFIKL